MASIPFFYARPASQPGEYTLQLHFTTDTCAITQIFFDLGRGYTERSSARRGIEPKSAQTPDLVLFPIPAGRLHRLRIDPLDRKGKFELGSARILKADGQPFLEIPVNQLQDVHAIARVPGQTNPALSSYEVIQGPEEQWVDPYIEVPLPCPVDVPPRVRFGLADRAANCLPIFFLVFTGTAIFLSAFALANKASQQTPLKGGSSLEGEHTLRRQKALWLAITGLALFKLWLVAGQTVHAIAGAPDDDQLFVNLAHNILGGRWLGSYDTHTLMKGSMYSVFIAGVFLSGVPLFTAQHILYAISCALVVRALRPFRLSGWLLLLLFGLLLFNPVTYEAGHHTRVLRQHLLNPLALAIVASGIGLFARRQMPLQRMVPWALLAGVSMPSFWMTREEGVWLLPCSLLLWALVIVALWRERPSVWRSRIALCCLPFVMFAAGIGGASWLNFIYYRVFTTCEVKHPAFKAAYGSLLRITPQQTGFHHISVHREMIERAYAISPAFASLRAHWELPSHRGEIPDAFFIWDLRNAVFDVGIGTDGKAAMEFYARMAREINLACDQGLIAAGGPRTGFVPPWAPEFTRRLPETALRALRFFVTFEGMHFTATPSVGSPEERMRFIDITRSRITPPEGTPPIPPRQRWLDKGRVSILATVYKIYQHLGLLAGASSLAAFLAALAISIRRKTLPCFLLLSAGLLGSCSTLVTICALVDTISFPAINTMYLSAGYGLWLLALVSSWIALVEAIRTKTRQSAPDSLGQRQ